MQPGKNPAFTIPTNSSDSDKPIHTANQFCGKLVCFDFSTKNSRDSGGHSLYERYLLSTSMFARAIDFIQMRLICRSMNTSREENCMKSERNEIFGGKEM
jgi:hypothetical protein